MLSMLAPQQNRFPSHNPRMNRYDRICIPQQKNFQYCFLRATCTADSALSHPTIPELRHLLPLKKSLLPDAVPTLQHFSLRRIGSEKISKSNPHGLESSMVSPLTTTILPLHNDDFKIGLTYLPSSCGGSAVRDRTGQYVRYVNYVW